MSDQIFINGKQIELFEDTIIALTLQINDLSALGNRQGNLSNKIKAPKSDLNTEIFESSEAFNSETDLPYRKIPARILREGIDVKGFEKCYAIIDESNAFYNITLYSGNLDFFDRLGTKKLSELDCSDLDHTWDLTTVSLSRYNTQGYIYPLIDTGWGSNNYSSSNRVTDIRYMIPAVYNHTIFSKILAAASYTATGDILTDQQYLKSAINCVSRKPGDLTSLMASAMLPEDIGVTQSGTPFVYYTTPIPMSQPIFDPLGLFQVGIFQPTNVVYKALAAGDYTFDVYINVTRLEAAVVSIYFAGAFLVAVSQGNHESHHVVTITLAAGQEVGLQGYSSFSSAGNLRYSINGGTSVTCTNINMTTVALGTQFPIASNLPDMTQAEFVLALLNIFCIFPQSNCAESIFEMHQFQKLADSKSSAPDWSRLLDGGDDASITYRLPGYAQQNYLKWAEDKSVSAGLGDGIISVNDTTLPAEKVMLQLPFAASQMFVALQGLDCLKISLADTSGNFNPDTKPRMFIIDQHDLTSGANISWYDGTSTYQSAQMIPFCYFILASKPYNLGFNDNLIRKNYAALTDAVRKPKILNDKFWLTEEQFNTLNFSYPVYVNATIRNKQIDGYFYANKLENYIPGQATKCILIRL